MARLSGILLLLWLVCSVSMLHAQESEEGVSGDEEYEEPVEKGFLIVRKKIFEPDVILGKNMTVTISIYNAGTR